eukprot:498817-Hanusia_phi.AAC.1
MLKLLEVCMAGMETRTKVIDERLERMESFMRRDQGKGSAIFSSSSSFPPPPPPSDISSLVEKVEGSINGIENTLAAFMNMTPQQFFNAPFTPIPPPSPAPAPPTLGSSSRAEGREEEILQQLRQLQQMILNISRHEHVSSSFLDSPRCFFSLLPLILHLPPCLKLPPPHFLLRAFLPSLPPSSDCLQGSNGVKAAGPEQGDLRGGAGLQLNRTHRPAPSPLVSHHKPLELHRSVSEQYKSGQQRLDGSSYSSWDATTAKDGGGGEETLAARRRRRRASPDALKATPNGDRATSNG